MKVGAKVRARAVVTRAALVALGVTADLSMLDPDPVLGHGEPVGSITAVGFDA